MDKVVAVVIAQNEAENLPRTMQILNGHKDAGLIHEIVVVNDASRDKTASLARKLGAEVVSHKRIGGKRKAFVTGAFKAKEMGATTMLVLDADLVHFSKDSLKHMLKMVAKEEYLMATAQQHEMRRTNKEFSRFGEVGNIYSNAQRAINMKGLDPLFNGNDKWGEYLVSQATAKGHRWGLEYALEKLVPANKKI
jgi:glycosyltransferase involved in cell wall biosynthesis